MNGKDGKFLIHEHRNGAWISRIETANFMPAVGPNLARF